MTESIGYFKQEQDMLVCSINKDTELT